MKRKDRIVEHAGGPVDGRAVSIGSALTATGKVAPRRQAEGLKAIKARFAAQSEKMLRKARQNCLELTGKDHV